MYIHLYLHRNTDIWHWKNVCHTKETVKHTGCKGTGDVISSPSASPASSWEHELRGGLRSTEEAQMGNLIAQYGQEWFSLYKGQFHGHLPWRAGGSWKLNCYLCVWKPLLKYLDKMVTGFYKNTPKHVIPVFLFSRVALPYRNQACKVLFYCSYSLFQ